MTVKRLFLVILTMQAVFEALLVAHELFHWKSDWTDTHGVNVWLPTTYLIVGVFLTVAFFLWMTERMKGRKEVAQNLVLLVMGCAWSAFKLHKWASMPDIEFSPIAMLCLYMMCAAILAASQVYVLVKRTISPSS